MAFHYTAARYFIAGCLISRPPNRALIEPHSTRVIGTMRGTEGLLVITTDYQYYECFNEWISVDAQWQDL
jgi:hypothetical protein